MNQPVIRWQIITPDPDASSKFFTQLFGWETSRNNPMGYREVRAGKGGIHGGVWPAPPGTKPFVQLYVQVENVAACIEKATALGAKVIVPKTVLPEGQEMAVLLDPQGMPVAISTA
jgi:predicted enzyme related to lactoylglutathione lyase